MADDEDEGASVLVFRDKDNRPVAVPEEVVAEAERPYRAYLLRREGKTWPVIASELGYLNAQAAQYDVGEYLRTGRSLVQDQNRREMLAMLVDRHEALVNALWPQAMQGHIPAVNSIAGLLNGEAKLLGLLDEKFTEESKGPRTVIVAADDATYRQMLEKAAEGV